MTKQALSLDTYRPKILLVGIHAPYNKIANSQSYFDEFLKLVSSNNITYDATLFFKLREIDAGTFVTRGKLAEIQDVVEKEQIDEVIISEPLSPQQERNLRDFLHCKVFDRTQLILEIFEKSAHSAEGKMQVQIAMLQHKKSRLAGKGIHLSQQAGGFGMMAGGGETAKEREKRHIEDEIAKLKKQLQQIEKVRHTQRKQRLNTAVPLICLVGYTNAGKSTILNALTKSNVLAEDRLFATLDTTTRQLFINGTKKGLLSDTVGFIQLLPPQLIEAFKSTLDELHYADLLLHVVDCSDPNWRYHINVVLTILHEINVKKPMLFVFNKIDNVDLTPRLQEELDEYHPNVLISAHSKEGLEPLINFLAEWDPKKEI